MVFLGLEKPVEYGAQQIFDPTMANMVLQAQQQYNNAARQEFYRGLQDIKDFQKEYGDFITPILADQDWYNKNVTGRVRDFINGAYERGIDLTRSPEGRAAITQLINSIPVGKVAKLRSSAKNAEEYLKNRGKLEAAGLYNPDLEERYLGYNLSNWDTINNDKIWTRTSPTEMKTLKEVTESWYNNRTPEILNQADVESFGMPYDRRYNYTGFADRHLLDIAAGETPGWRGSLYADYYRDLAERKVAARGIPYTSADVERQLQQDIAVANREYKSIKRDADEYEKMNVANKYAQSNIYLQHKLAADRAAKAHEYAMDLQALKNEGKGGGSGGKNTRNGLFQYGEATQDQAIMKLVGSLVGEMEEKDPVTGKTKKVTVQDASRDTILEAYYKKVLTPYRKYMRNLFNSHINYKKGDLDGGTHGTHAVEQYLKKFGYIDSPAGFEASMGKKVNSEGKVEFTAADIDNMYTDAELLAMADGYRGFKSGHSHRAEIERALSVRDKNKEIALDMDKLVGKDASGYIEGMRGTTDMPNKVPVILPDGRMVMFRAVNVKYGNKTTVRNTGRLWIPTGSPTLPKSYTQTKKGLRIAGLNPYTDESEAMAQIEENARYSQATGSQKNQNVSLPTDVEDEIDPVTLYNYLLNGNLE